MRCSWSATVSGCVNFNQSADAIHDACSKQGEGPCLLQLVFHVWSESNLQNNVRNKSSNRHRACDTDQVYSGRTEEAPLGDRRILSADKLYSDGGEGGVVGG